MEPQKNEPLRAERLNKSDGVASQSDEEFPSSRKSELEDEMLQEEYRRRHLEQLRRLQCPGCGETELF